MSRSAPRFYTPQFTHTSNTDLLYGTLDGAEARHAISVLRLSVDDRIHLFDGTGHEVVARIAVLKKQQLEFEVVECITSNLELPHELILAIALPKGERQKILVDAATELGVTKLIPLRLHRAVAQPTDSALERLRRQVIEACKQCGRNRLMTIAEPLNLNGLLEQTRTTQTAKSCSLQLVAHPYDQVHARHHLAKHLNGAGRPVTVVIGPEGGLTDEEVGLFAEQAWQVVDLGKTILRIEIAGIAAVAQIAAWLSNHS